MSRLTWKPHYWGSVFYLMYFAAAGALIPYLNLFFQRVGIDKPHIGVLAALQTLTTLVAGPLWSGLADALRLHKWILPLAMLGVLAPVGWLTQAHSFIALVPLVLGYAICLAPIIPLADNAVLEMLGADRHQYGGLRLWGAVGFGLSAWGVGELANRGTMLPAFITFIVLMAIGALVATRLPAPRLATQTTGGAGLRQLVTDIRWAGFLAALLLVGIGSSMFMNFFAIYLNGLGAGTNLIGLATMVATVSELPVFFLSPLILRRVGARGLLLISFGTYAIRTFVYVLIHDPNWLIASQLLHGLTFSALWAGGVSYANQIAPPGWGTTAQSVFGSVYFGLAGATGALLGGVLYQRFGPETMFGASSLAALLGLALFGVTEFYLKRVVVLDPKNS
jgi:PPP family 3-phenylpropionic acid transporter